MNAKQFLLCSINIKDKKVWSELITATGSMNEKELLVDGWELFNEEQVRYNESSVHDFNYRNSLLYSRNFSLLSSTVINHSESLTKEFESISVNHRDVTLIVDYHGNFLFIIAYQAIMKQDADVSDAIKSFFRNRSIIDNVGDRDWYNQTEQAVKLEVAKYVNKVLEASKLNPDKIELNPDAAFPLFMSDAATQVNLQDLFNNEENIKQRSERNPLSEDYDGSFFHVGWNYTLAINYPREVNEHIFSLMTKMQMSYYKFRYYKDYFDEAFNDLFKNAQNIDSDKVDFFDRIQLNYFDFLSNYYKFKLGLFPKFYDEMDRVEKLWHMDKDMELMDKTFNAQAEFVNKKYNEISQEINDKQNQALNIIAFVQIIAFLSVIYDSIMFEAAKPTFFWVSLLSVVLLLVILVIRYIRIGKVRKLSK